ncbi:MAG TPA: family 78 glycoside hydrolase catalytic domain, partial [Vicinamibacteria bacterium]|nr:family 78 glycoside hydrolase catalytic domain [Vicinamibacteria bacterium]
MTTLPLFLLLATLVPGRALAAPDLITRPWPARWIAHPTAEGSAYGVYLFRKELDLRGPSGPFVIHVSADNRYRLWVNGQPVCFGPQLGDLRHWHYDTIDIAPFLRAGRNTIAARVWNYGPWKPYSIMSAKTGFLVQGADEAGQAANTDASWKVVQDGSYAAVPVDAKRLNTFIVIAPGERIDGAVHPWGWEQPGFDDRRWLTPRDLGPATPHSVSADVTWWLVPRTIPFMEERVQRLARVRRSAGIAATDSFLKGEGPLVIPKDTAFTLLLDQGHETLAYPQLRVSGGAGSRLTLSYAEALFDRDGGKGHRDQIDGKTLLGVDDAYLPDGGEGRLFSTLNFRCFRYVQIEGPTAGTPLRIDDFHGVFTAYPLEERGAFASEDELVARIWETSWRTTRLGAAETFIDSYYEQMQYLGDTRVQALISLYVSGDDRLMRNAIELFDQSRVSEGLTQSRYPSNSVQIINTYSLIWIDMLHDYWRLRGDEAWLRLKVNAIQGIVDWFAGRIDRETGMLGPLHYWSFVDWPDEWPWDPVLQVGGEPPGAREGGSSIITLQYAGTLRRAAELVRALGHPDLADRYELRARALGQATLSRCWDEKARLVADTPARSQFSQHANIQAVLSGSIEGDEARALMRRVLATDSLTQASLYYRFYLHRALRLAGLGDLFL